MIDMIKVCSFGDVDIIYNESNERYNVMLNSDQVTYFYCLEAAICHALSMYGIYHTRSVTRGLAENLTILLRSKEIDSFLDALEN